MGTAGAAGVRSGAAAATTGAPPCDGNDMIDVESSSGFGAGSGAARGGARGEESGETRALLVTLNSGSRGAGAGAAPPATATSSGNPSPGRTMISLPHLRHFMRTVLPATLSSPI